MQQGPYSPEQPSYPPAPPQTSYPVEQPTYPPPQTSYPPSYSSPLPQQQQQYYAPQQSYPAPQQPYGFGAPVTTYTRSSSFTNKAVIAFLLYFLGYVPGLIFNIMYLNEANNVRKELGRTPEGIGCLWATLIASLVPLGLFVLCAVSIIAAGALGGAQH